jgi:hypothetical protein
MSLVLLFGAEFIRRTAEKDGCRWAALQFDEIGQKAVASEKTGDGSHARVDALMARRRLPWQGARTSLSIWSKLPDK